ncbi:MAG: leucyl aminopeptidase family protein [Myxococcales bacterium]|nr:leucyl aminopeptidase family protein [Myxococcales bacterium]
MSQLTFSASADDLAAVDQLIVIGRSADLAAGWPFADLPAHVADWGARLAADARPGRTGGPATTLLPSGDGPSKLSVIALHDSVTRHVSDTRAEEIWGQLRGLASGLSGQVGVLVAMADPAHALGAALGVARCFPLYSRKTKPNKLSGITVGLCHSGGWITDTTESGIAADAIRLTQRVVDMPPAELDTQTFENEARQAVEHLPNVSVTSIVGDDLLQAGLGGLHAVGRAAMVAPRLVVLDYEPPGATETIALVGKGLVYDTGGLSLKIVGDRMLTMKCDMGGAGAVLGAFTLLAQTKLPKRVIAVLAMAENAIGPDSYRPDDVLKMHSGKTVEINNTDAEGRLALADAASFVARGYEPAVIIEAATLTGAQLMATGKAHAGICATDADLEQRALAAGLATGDHCLAMLWSPAHMRAEFKSKVADMRNSVADRMNASSAAAGFFVYSHIEDTGSRFLHIDLAGPSFRDNRATGYGVGLITGVVREF